MQLKSIPFVMLFFCVWFSAHAKRTAPDPVRPLIYKGVRYEAPPWGYVHHRDQNGGYVEAKDVKTHKLLWALKVYDVEYDPRLEGDVQDVFITALSAKKGYLFVTDELDRIFSINLLTHEVKRIKGKKK